MRERKRIFKKYDVVVAGGGLSGVCAALASARNGAKTAIIQNRSVFGGCSSSEIRMHICGANCHARKPNLAETGILEELLLTNKAVNHNFSFPLWDIVMRSKIKSQENLDAYLNTTMDEVTMDGNKIKTIICRQSSTEYILEFSAEIFIDATGNASLGFYSGADFHMGSESRDEFKEPHAPEKENNYTMGNTIMFISRDLGEKIPFKAPSWSAKFTEDDFKDRPHGNVSLDRGKNGIIEEYSVSSGYWWIELGGDSGDIIGNAEKINDELYQTLFGVWDHIKNGGDHGADQYELDWIGSVPGIRESRRLLGDYILTENDIVANRHFHDAVAYGGWPMDMHSPRGFYDEIPTTHINYDGCYTIPFRCYYSRNVDNLMMAGRDISTSKMAFGSARVMGTCSIGGQAAGTAAAMAVKHKCLPREFGEKYICELQQQLLKDDCYIPGIKNTDPLDGALQTSNITASSFKVGNEPEKVISGISRAEADDENCWVSDGISPNGESISLQFDKERQFNEVRLTFDPNLNTEIMISMTKRVQEKEVKGMPIELVKDFSVEIRNSGKVVWQKNVQDNIDRLCVLQVPENISGDELRVTATATYGCPEIRIFEIRVY